MIRRTLLAVLYLACSVAGADPPSTRTHEVIALVGGAQLVAAAELGYLEALLAVRDQGNGPRVRDLSWEGDTVFARPRSVNFPSLTHLLVRVGATAVVLQFGQMESLSGRGGVEEFSSAYETLLNSVREVVPQVVLLTPPPFAPAGPIEGPLAKSRNQDLALYVAEIQRLGTQLNLPVIDVFRGLEPSLTGPIELTTDGVQLTERGQRLMAQWVALYDLRSRSVLPAFPDNSGILNQTTFEPVRQAVIAKNRLWVRYWRPTNWAFLAGDRTEQMSSRDHRDRNIRWFPQEMEEYVPLLAAADAEIAQRAKAAGKPETTR